MGPSYELCSYSKSFARGLARRRPVPWRVRHGFAACPSCLPAGCEAVNGCECVGESVRFAPQGKCLLPIDNFPKGIAVEPDFGILGNRRFPWEEKPFCGGMNIHPELGSDANGESSPRQTIDAPFYMETKPTTERNWE